MTEYFRLTSHDSQHLAASSAGPDASTCSTAVCGHRNVSRSETLALQLDHNQRDQQVISLLLGGMFFHSRLLEEFEKRGFTGYRLKPATVRFRDGQLSQEYSKLVVTGWAGIAPSESGIELLEACDVCGYKKYSSLRKREHLIDWTQWAGEDFFMVWPLPHYLMITKRVADALSDLKAKSYKLESMLTPPPAYARNWGFSVGVLSDFLPEDLAMKYGEPLGLQCPPGRFPKVEKRPEPPSEESDSGFDFGSEYQELQTLEEKIRNSQGADRQSAFVALLARAEGERAIPDRVFSLALQLLEQEVLTRADVAPHAQAFLAPWNAMYPSLQAAQRESVSFEWLLEDQYRELRGSAEVLLDVLGYVAGDAAARALNDALEFHDPRLKVFAVLSLLRRGDAVDPAHIEQVAASLEMREIFWRMLTKMNKQSLMPEHWAQPEQLAASDLCHWASHPNELAVPPEEVEVMAEFQIEPEEGDVPDRVFLFRFRAYPKPWEPGEGWMAGIAGPNDSPWSSFKRWDSMTPDEHFEKLYYRGSACSMA